MCLQQLSVGCNTMERVAGVGEVGARLDCCTELDSNVSIFFRAKVHGCEEF